MASPARVPFAAFHSDYASANAEVARIVASRPNRFYGFAFVHPERDRGRVYDLVKIAVECYGFVGIKVHRHEGRITREICETARVFSLPVLYDVKGEVSVCELLAQEYPKLNLIIPHIGSFADTTLPSSFLTSGASAGGCASDRYPRDDPDSFSLLRRGGRIVYQHRIDWDFDGI